MVIDDGRCIWRGCRAEPRIGYRGAWLCNRHWGELALRVENGTPALSVIRNHFAESGRGMDLADMEARSAKVIGTEAERGMADVTS